jgi:hypothetical protein
MPFDSVDSMLAITRQTSTIGQIARMAMTMAARFREVGTGGALVANRFGLACEQSKAYSARVLFGSGPFIPARVLPPADTRTPECRPALTRVPP